MASAAEWAVRVKEWRASGESASSFAKDKEYTAKLLQWWSTELQRRAKRAAKTQADTPKEVVKIARVATTTRQLGTSMLRVRVGRAEIQVSQDFDRRLFREVIEALGETR